MPLKGKRVKVAIASDFLTAFSGIPKKQQVKVMEFVNKFREDPMLAGINYEKIHNAKDPNLHSVRIDQTYRGIVMKPENDNVYVLLWVDHHDKAYKWAENKICRVHPEIGSLQIFDVEETRIPETPEADDHSVTPHHLFDDIHDRHLIRLGVPEMLLHLVRGLNTAEDLDQVAHKLPQEAYDALFFIASGFSLDEVFQELERQKEPQVVDTNDYEKALDNPDSRLRFYVVEDELELAAILSAPLERWRVFLHPSQTKLVERDWNGPVRVLGGAGTGKTVAAMHRARWLAKNVFTDENDRILFTTFTINLAADIRENLKKICPDDLMRRIEVVNLDKWVSNFLQRQGYNYKIDYGTQIGPLWQKALDMAPPGLGLPPALYREEWERIIQFQEITSLDEYMKASRIGRGIRLNRKARKEIWPVFEEYRILLNERGLREADDAMRDARLLLEEKGDILPYRAVIVDEAQDMGPQALKLIRRMIPGEDGKNGIFIVGDAHQRIYRHKITLSNCGINVRGRSRKLRINYRTTEETRRWAVCLLNNISIDDMDGGTDDQKGYTSLLHGDAPDVRHFDSFNEEVDFIEQYLSDLQNEGESLSTICLVARTNELLKQYEAALKEKGLQSYFIRRSQPEDRRAPGLRLTTMHRIKGLEFDRVIIAGVNEGIIPYEKAINESSDSVVRKDGEIRERALLYVSSTRAKRSVLITSFSHPSKFLQC